MTESQAPPAGPDRDRPAGAERAGSDALARLWAARALAGLPAPAFNPDAPRACYRFLLAGVLVLVGCLMPFGPQPVPGYYSTMGGIMLIVALGVVWSMWGAIQSGHLRLLWILLMFIPLVWSVMHVVFAFHEPAVVAGMADARLAIRSWGDFVSTLVDRGDPSGHQKCSEFLRILGPGKLLILLGSALAEVQLLLALVTGLTRGRRAPP